MNPLLISFFFLFCLFSSVLSYLSSLLCALPHVSELTQLSPQKYWTHPPLITLTRPAITPFSVLECSEVTHLSLLSTDHPPLITLTKPTIFFSVLSFEIPQTQIYKRNHTAHLNKSHPPHPSPTSPLTDPVSCASSSCSLEVSITGQDSVTQRINLLERTIQFQKCMNFAMFSSRLGLFSSSLLKTHTGLVFYRWVRIETKKKEESGRVFKMGFECLLTPKAHLWRD